MSKPITPAYRFVNSCGLFLKYVLISFLHQPRAKFSWCCKV